MKFGRTVDEFSGEYVPSLISGFGVLLLGLLAGWLVAFRTTVSVTGLVLLFGTVFLPAAGLVWGGIRLDRSGIEPDRYDRIGGWTLGCGVVFLLINAATIAVYPWHTLSGNLIWAHWAVTMGGIAGFAIGSVEARAIQQEVEATAATVRADQLEAEREVLAYLNDLLRHEVLNSAQIISGHASLIQADDPDGPTQQRLETIQHESDALAAVIDDIRAMLEANRYPGDSSVVDLSDLLAETVAATRIRHDDADIELETPVGVLVSGNDGLAWIFSNLLENAIEHNDSERPHATVDVEPSGDDVVVTVSDDGPGIDPDTRERLFERRSRNHGLGLYLTRVLADRYDAAVELVETGPDGTTFAVRLPRASEVQALDGIGDHSPSD